jgi:hypothetical protein
VNVSKKLLLPYSFIWLAFFYVNSFTIVPQIFRSNTVRLRTKLTLVAAVSASKRWIHCLKKKCGLFSFVPLIVCLYIC